jgi:hypothetical protein
MRKVDKSYSFPPTCKDDSVFIPNVWGTDITFVLGNDASPIGVQTYNFFTLNSTFPSRISQAPRITRSVMPIYVDKKVLRYQFKPSESKNGFKLPPFICNTTNSQAASQTPLLISASIAPGT